MANFLFLWCLHQMNAATTSMKAMHTTAITGEAIVIGCVADCSDWPAEK